MQGFSALAILLVFCMVVSGTTWGDINVSAPEIFLNSTGDGSDVFRAIDPDVNMNSFGHGNATIAVINHSRLVSVWASPNMYTLEPVKPGEERRRTDLSEKADTVNITVGKDGQYKSFGFGEYANFSMGISPEWNQTLEIYVQSKEAIWCCFEIWGLIVPGSIWVNGTWEIDNPEQVDQYVLLASVGPEGVFNPIPVDEI